MSKSDQNAAKQQAKEAIATNNANQTAAAGQIQDVMGTAKSTAASVLPSVVSGYSDIQSGGGFDPAILGTINQTFGNLATTGGISSMDETRMQNRAAEAARSTYDVAGAEAKRKLSATGGMGVSGSIVGNLAREGSHAAATAAEDTAGSIAGLKQAGMIAGGQGLAATQNAMAQNKLQATSGLGNIYGMNEQQVTATVDQILRNYQQTGQLNNQDLTILTNLANQPGVFDKIVSTVGTIGGAAAGAIGAIAPKGLVP